MELFLFSTGLQIIFQIKSCLGQMILNVGRKELTRTFEIELKKLYYFIEETMKFYVIRVKQPKFYIIHIKLKSG